MKSWVLLALALSALPGARAFEVNKCVDTAGRVGYQQQPCVPGSREQTLEVAVSPPPATRPARSEIVSPAMRVRLEGAALHFEPMSRGSGLRLNFAPRWVNAGATPVRVRFRVRLYDEADTELAVYSRFVDLDAQVTSRAPRLLATLAADGPGSFDAAQVARVSVAYSVAGAERILDGVRIVR